MARELPEKFQIALSFAGEQREFVRSVATELENRLGSSSVFFDEWFEHYIAGYDADLRLQDIYGKRCALVVVCVSKHYGDKPWTRAEHEAIRARVMKARCSADKRDELGILPIRVGTGDVAGIEFNVIVPDVRERTPEATASLIIDRLRLITSDTVGATTEMSTTTIVFDESYRQKGWRPSPVIGEGYSMVAAAVAKNYSVMSNAGGYSIVDALSPKSILILPMPRGYMVDELHHENLTNWVYRGGRLVLLGFYLMELHHYSNLNHLARRFGFDFSCNLTMPYGCEDWKSCNDQSIYSAEHEFWITTRPIASPASHPIIEGIYTLAITSSCTVEPAVTPDLLISTADSVAVMHARGLSNPQGRLYFLTDYVLDKHDSAPILVALRYGAGRVVGVGSWKMFINDLVKDKDCDNMMLFRNVISWLSLNESESRDVTLRRS